ncbi:hypothetical protein KL925_000441 [Ogataea polymorpha]|nr:hypothetical protein KL937_000219 [Ogataea polymorpha]KAG7895733.1 hypothetical protein KL936_000441 [Ogataea polymorpha]KAG7896388.1 hypothetical protein KL908_000902 [Ogataea polymorpha]KAG7929699.1 hypothetical protein KL925_000441 [Ogataea polymorpha]KAG7940467.1 hypothetical protein KL904_000330 [Ogataea polymorpha]
MLIRSVATGVPRQFEPAHYDHLASCSGCSGLPVWLALASEVAAAAPLVRGAHRPKKVVFQIITDFALCAFASRIQPLTCRSATAPRGNSDGPIVTENSSMVSVCLHGACSTGFAGFRNLPDAGLGHSQIGANFKTSFCSETHYN